MILRTYPSQDGITTKYLIQLPSGEAVEATHVNRP
jgi:hypothetical protein